MNFFKKRLNKKGFTLVELLIVIAVLGILAGIGVNSMSGITTTFKKNADQQTAEMLARVVEVKILAGEIDKDDTATTVATAISTELGEAVSQQTNAAFTITEFTLADGAATATITFSGTDQITINGKKVE